MPQKTSVDAPVPCITLLFAELSSDGQDLAIEY